MNKSELINAIAEEAGLAKTDAKKALEAFISTVSNELAKGEKIALIGFGTFSINEKVKEQVSILLQNSKLLFLPRKWLSLKPVLNWQIK